MVSIRHRPETRALALLEEDFIYGDIPALAPVELRDFICSLHNIAEARPLIIEFSKARRGRMKRLPWRLVLVWRVSWLPPFRPRHPPIGWARGF